MIVIYSDKNIRLFIKHDLCTKLGVTTPLHIMIDGKYVPISYDDPIAVDFLEKHVPDVLSVKRLTGNLGLLALPGKGLAYIRMTPLKDGKLRYFRLGENIFYWKPDYIANGDLKIRSNTKEIKGYARWYGVYQKKE